MQLESSRHLDASPELVWKKLNDTATLKQCIAGCEALEPDGQDRYRVTLKTRIGPVSATFRGRLSLTDIAPGETYTLNFDGQGGAAGFGRGSAVVKLEPVARGTDLRYRAKAEIGGRLAQIGQRLVDGAARAMVDDFFARFEQSLAPAAPEPRPPLPWQLWVGLGAAVLLALWLALVT